MRIAHLRPHGIMPVEMSFLARYARFGGDYRRMNPIENPVFLPEEYLPLFGCAGSCASLFVGYEERPDDRRDPPLCFVCEALPG